MRTVSGPTDHVLVVGAGLAGLAAALHLRGQGREVTVLERDTAPGGRMGVLDGPGYRMDSGATVLTMPELVTEALAVVGLTPAQTDPALEFTRLDPAYRARFADGTVLDVHSDPEAMAAEIAAVIGPEAVPGYHRLRAWLAAVFETEYDRFMAGNFDSPLDLVASAPARADLRALLRLGAFGRLGPKVGRLIADERLRRVFTFQALYAGLAPRSALGVYGAIAHMDTSLGVYFPTGGMHTVTAAMADGLRRAGGRVELGCEVTGVDYDTGRAVAVRTADGRRIACDVLVLTADLPVVDRLLAPAPRRGAPVGRLVERRPVRWSPSAVVLHGTIDRAVSERWDRGHHHTIDFGRAWDSTFTEITARRGRGRLMTDPSLLITRPGLTDPELDPVPGRELLSVLAPCPNLDSAPLDWSRLAGPYTAELLGVLEARGYHGITAGFAIDHVHTPDTWAAQGMGAGSPFAAAHTFPQTGPFRRRNLVAGLANVVLAGSGTTPGVGVPTALLSGRLAARRVLGDGVDSLRTAESPHGSGTLDNRSHPPRRPTRPRSALGEQNP